MHYLKYSDYQDYTARVDKKGFRNNCSSTSLKSPVETLRIEIKPVVAKENEIEKWKTLKTFWNLFDLWEYQVSDARNKINGIYSEAFLLVSIFKMTPR